MNPRPHWHEEPLIFWLSALSLLVKLSVKPSLPELGLPEAITLGLAQSGWRRLRG